MPEYIEREAFFKFLTGQMTRKQNGAFAKGFNKGIMVARAAVHNKEITPTADVVEVVRCKDCKDNSTGYVSEGTIWCDRYHARRALESFCSYGKRKNSLPEDIKQTVLDSFMKDSDS